MSFLRSTTSTLIKLPKLLPSNLSRNYATTTSTSSTKSFLSKVTSGALSTVLVLGTGAFLIYSHDSSAGIHRYVFLPALGLITADNPELAHEIAVKVIGSGLAPVDQGEDGDSLAFELWGRKYSNPLGMAAGFDKHGEAIDGLFNLGFGYVEIGSVTPEPQPGNPKPRVFRIPETNSLINRYGFNSEGHSTVVSRLRQRILSFVSQNSLTLPPSIFPFPPLNALPQHDVVAQLLASPEGANALVVDNLDLPRSLTNGKVLAVNLGKNKTSAGESHEDFVKGVESLGPYADILVINVSSPNTPGLRSLQRKDMLEELLTSVVKARDELKHSLNGSNYIPPILVKIAPDLTSEEIQDIAHAVQISKIDGIIISNTTISRPPTAGTSIHLNEVGGLSGPPVKSLALKCLSEMYQATEGKVVLIGCGGIKSGEDAVEFAKAGATMVQLYTGFIYGGIGLPRLIKEEIKVILEKEGKKNWVELIGSGNLIREKIVPVVEPVVIVEQIPVESLGGGEGQNEVENLLRELRAAESLESLDISTPSTTSTSSTSEASVASLATTATPSPVLNLLDTEALAELFKPEPVVSTSTSTSTPTPTPLPTSTPTETIAENTSTTASAPILVPSSTPVEESASSPVESIKEVIVVEVPAPVSAPVPVVVVPEVKKEEAKSEVISLLPPVKGDGKRWV